MLRGYFWAEHKKRGDVSLSSGYEGPRRWTLAMAKRCFTPSHSLFEKHNGIRKKRQALLTDGPPIFLVGPSGPCTLDIAITR